MRVVTLVALAAVAPALAKDSWFGSSDPQPTQWTQEKLDQSQKFYQNVKEDTFKQWDESRLRQFLLDNGVIEPKGTREQLVQLAKQQYWAYTSAVSSLSAAASTAVYGDSYHQATKSAESVVNRATDSAASYASDASSVASAYAVTATDSVVRAFDESRDYVYSTWDDNQLRTWLEEKNLIKTKQQAKRDELFATVKQYYLSATDPIYKAWADSYIREWLVSHNIIVPPPTTREKLLAQMDKYYYDTKEYIWSTWSDNQLKDYLVKHDIIKSNAELNREKMERLVKDNWAATNESFWSSWQDSEIREWLIEHSYIKNDAEVKRDELLKLFQSKYHDVAARTADWTTWTDARARAWLRLHGVPEDKIPGDRPSLLHEVRIRYVITEKRINGFLGAIRDAISGSVEAAEERLGDVLSILSGAKDDAAKKKAQLFADAESKAKAAEASASSLKAEATKLKSEL